MTSVTMRQRTLLAVVVLLGLFLMHGLQTFCNDSSAGGHEMGNPASGSTMLAPTHEHSESMAPASSGVETVASQASHGNATTGGGMMLDLCVAILVAGALLAGLRRRLLWQAAQRAVQTLRVRPDRARLCWWPPGRTLSILCVMRT